MDSVVGGATQSDTNGVGLVLGDESVIIHGDVFSWRGGLFDCVFHVFRFDLATEEFNLLLTKKAANLNRFNSSAQEVATRVGVNVCVGYGVDYSVGTTSNRSDSTKETV